MIRTMLSTLALIGVFSVTFTAFAVEAEMTGIDTVEVYVEPIGQEASEECGIRYDNIKTEVEFSLANYPKIKLLDTGKFYGWPRVYVRVSALYIASSSICAAHIRMEFRLFDVLVNPERPTAVVWAPIYDDWRMIACERNAFPQQVYLAVDQMIKKLIVEHSKQNQ